MEERFKVAKKVGMYGIVGNIFLLTITKILSLFTSL